MGWMTRVEFPAGTMIGFLLFARVPRAPASEVKWPSMKLTTQSICLHGVVLS
jgi:hypothetical protein